MSETLNVSARGDAGDSGTTAGTVSKVIARDAAGIEGTTLVSLSLSSEHFSFVAPENENEETVRTIDQTSQLFTGLAKKPPTLLEVLVSMNTRSQKNLLSYSQRRQQKN